MPKNIKSSLMIILFATLGVSSAYGQTGFDLFTNNREVKLPGILEEAVVNEIMCDGGFEIKDHMGRMGFIIRGLSEMVDNIIHNHDLKEVRDKIMMDSQMLRTHLAAVLPKTAPKIQNYDPENIQKNKLIFQTYLNKMIGLTLELEQELFTMPMTPEEVQIQALKVAKTIVEIDETVDKAHKQFRF